MTNYIKPIVARFDTDWRFNLSEVNDFIMNNDNCEVIHRSIVSIEFNIYKDAGDTFRPNIHLITSLDSIYVLKSKINPSILSSWFICDFDKFIERFTNHFNLFQNNRECYKYFRLEIELFLYKYKKEHWQFDEAKYIIGGFKIVKEEFDSTIKTINKL